MTARGFVVAACMVVPSLAHADPTAADIQAQGEQLAKDGRFSEAIDKFKAADRLERRASHACLIALAYMRRELWPQAEIFLDECHQRATASDPLPAWVPDADNLIKERLTAANVAAVEITTDPAEPGVQLTVSSFAPDELFEPRTIHLPPGHHTIIAHAPGFLDARQDLEITDKTPQKVVVVLRKPEATGAPRQPPPPPPRIVHSTSKVPWILIGAGSTLVAVNVILEATWYKTARDKLDNAPDLASYKAYEPTYNKRRDVVIGLYAAGGAAVITGIVLRYTVYKDRPDEAPMMALEPRDGGGIVSVGWQR